MSGMVMPSLPLLMREMPRRQWRNSMGRNLVVKESTLNGQKEVLVVIRETAETAETAEIAEIVEEDGTSRR